MNEYILESINVLIYFLLEKRKPKRVYVRDEDTKMYLKDILDKAGVKLAVISRLKAIDKFHNSLSRMEY